MSTMTYPHRFPPLSLPGTGVTLPNRAIVGSMHLGLEDLPGREA